MSSADAGERVQPDAARQPQGREHDHGVLGILDLGAIANEVRRAHDAERARQAVPTTKHDERADAGEMIASR